MSNCEGCVFQQKNGENIQIGCKLNRLTGIKQEGSELIFNEETKSFEFDRICSTKRPIEWVKNPKEDLEIKVRLEVRNVFEAIFYISDEEEFNLDKFDKVLSTLNYQQYKPDTVSFALSKDCKVKFNDIKNLLKNYQFKWRIDKALREKHKEESIDDILKKSEATFYTLLNLNSNVPYGYYSVIETSINENMKRVVLVNDNEKYNIGPTINRFVHESFFGNSPVLKSEIDTSIERDSEQDDILYTIIDKLRFANSREKYNFIFDWEDLFGK